MGKGLKIWAWVMTLLATVGLLAWGVYGITGFFGTPFLLVDWIFRIDWLINTVYTIVGIIGLSLIPTVIAMTLGKRG